MIEDLDRCIESLHALCENIEKDTLNLEINLSEGDFTYVRNRIESERNSVHKVCLLLKINLKKSYFCHKIGIKLFWSFNRRS
jgi:hypothetical protein